MRVLVTGATGRLGSRVAQALVGAGHEVRRMSSRPGPELVHGDLATGQGLAAALAGVEGVVHAASAPQGDVQQVDVEGVRRLTEAAAGSVRHLVHVSIVGIDDSPYRYYRAKLAAERHVLASALPVSVVRATQFHEFVDELCGLARRGPLLPAPAGWLLQPVAVSEVAVHLADLVVGEPTGTTTELAGPERLTAVELARLWARAQPRPPRVVPVPVPGRISRAFRAGRALSEFGERGALTYADHVGSAQRQPRRPRRARR